MTAGVHAFDSPQAAHDMARNFLCAEPVLNNLILTLLAARIARPEAGRYWIAGAPGAVTGVALQSPLDLPVNLSAMVPEAAASLADAIAAEGHDLPGVLGEASLAARFAGQWADRRGVGVRPELAQRIYAARAIRPGPRIPGIAEQAGPRDRSLLCEWMAAFRDEVGSVHEDVGVFVDRCLAGREFWLWRDGEIKSMAANTAPLSGVSRVRYVYTPPGDRRKGYAEALVRDLTACIIADGLTAMLYAELANPTSNAIYRRIGYEPSAELVRYAFSGASEPKQA